MDKASSSTDVPYKELWKLPLVGQTTDANLDSIYEGLEEVQKLVLDRTRSQDEQRIV